MEISETLKKFRKQKSLSQKDLAYALDISQEHVSRIERGATEPSEQLLQKIGRLLRAEESKKLEKIQKGSFQKSKFEKLKIASYVYPDRKASGDRVFIFDDKKGKTVILHYDITGHGPSAKDDADKLYWLATTLSVVLEGMYLTIESVYQSLDRIVKSTKSSWVGYPGCSITLYNHHTEQLSFLNAGMPYAYLLNHKSGKVDLIKSQNPTIGNMGSNQKIQIETFSLRKVGFLFLCSDGFKEFFSTIASVPFENVLESYGDAFSSEIESIAGKIVKTLEDKTVPNDDMSFVGIGFAGK